MSKRKDLGKEKYPFWLALKPWVSKKWKLRLCSKLIEILKGVFSHRFPLVKALNYTDQGVTPRKSVCFVLFCSIVDLQCCVNFRYAVK